MVPKTAPYQMLSCIHLSINARASVSATSLRVTGAQLVPPLTQELCGGGPGRGVPGEAPLHEVSELSRHVEIVQVDRQVPYHPLGCGGRVTEGRGRSQASHAQSSCSATADMAHRSS